MERARLTSDLALYRRLLRQARPYRFHLLALFGIGLLASPIALLHPVPLRIVVDSVLGAPRFGGMVFEVPNAKAVYELPLGKLWMKSIEEMHPIIREELDKESKKCTYGVTSMNKGDDLLFWCTVVLPPINRLARIPARP